MDNLTAIIEKKEFDIIDLKSTVAGLEMKNRKLSDVVNKAIHSQTQENIDKTMSVFKKNPKLSGDARMQDLMYKKPLSVENALADLEYAEQQKQIEDDANNARPPESSADVIKALEKMGPGGGRHFPGEQTDEFDAEYQLGGKATEAGGITRLPQTEEEAVRNRAHT
jgi:hypothetical protein